MNIVNKDNLTHCPICRGELFAYSTMGINREEASYCPNCDIIRFRYMSFPYLCKTCYSESFYRVKTEPKNKYNSSPFSLLHLDEKEICWYCGNNEFFKTTYADMVKNGYNKSEGYKLSQQFVEINNVYQCKHKKVTNIRHNETMFKFTCEACGYSEYVNVPKWLQKEDNIKDTIVSKQK